MNKVIVIGAGAAGCMAAITAAKNGASVILLEKNEKICKKVFITGKGRCNVTNACDTEDFFGNVLANSKFLYSSVYGFDNNQVMSFFEEGGCPLKVERGNRVFPVSDHSSDIIKVLSNEIRKNNVELRLNAEVEKLILSEDKTSIKGVQLSNYKEKLFADKIIVTTGGCSYVLTGSTGDGYKFAKSVGHEVTDLSPALVPFAIKEEWCKELQGLSLKNVTATMSVDGKKLYSEMGEMLFTHYGVSGPLILSASSFYAHKGKGKEAVISIDLKPALSYEQLDKRILRDFDENKNKVLKNVITALYPSKLVPVIPRLCDIDPDKKVNEITKEERERIVEVTKNLTMHTAGLRDYNEAIITKGGISLKGINPSTMESKIISGLYFAGEVLDLDAVTGGFNLQIAWSTGHLAGESAAQ